VSAASLPGRRGRWRTQWTRPHCATRSQPYARHPNPFPDLSTAHLPEQLCDQFGDIPGVLAHESDYCWYTWVAQPARRHGVHLETCP